MKFSNQNKKARSQSDTTNDKLTMGAGKRIFWTTLIGITAISSGIVAAGLTLFTPINPVTNPIALGKNTHENWRDGFKYNIARPVNILVMGMDRDPDVTKNSDTVFSGRSDTILLIRLDSNDNSLKMLSIPRDTRVEKVKLSLPKINQANFDGGVNLAAKVVSATLNNVSIDRYVRISTGAFRELIDQVGGVEVFVPKPMHYVDQSQNLNINLQPGWQTLNGDKAEQFVRFRHDEIGDIGRVQRQQLLLKSLRQRLADPSVVPRLPQIIQTMWKYVDTNLSPEETLALVNFGMSLQPESVKMVMLPGNFSESGQYNGSYWIMNQHEKDRIMQEFFHVNNPHKNAHFSFKPGKLRIGIQNATNQPQVSDKLANYLTKNGFTNIYFTKPWTDLKSETKIIAQKGNLKAAQKIQKMLGVGKIEADSTGDIDSDITIRIGKDWHQKK